MSRSKLFAVLKIFPAVLLLIVSSAAGAQDFECRLWNRSSGEWASLSNKSPHKRVRIYAYLPDAVLESADGIQGNGSRTAVLVFPGGSYYWLGIKREGHRVAEYLRSEGIAAFVVRYSTGMYGAMYPDQLEDYRAALDFVRKRAVMFNVDTSRIGVLGFSAGGHLAGCAALERVPYKAAFAGMIYPVVTMNKEWVHKDSRHYLLRGRESLASALSLEDMVKQDISPIFVLQCDDDGVVDPRNSSVFVDRLMEAGADFEAHFYRKGGHGFGIAPPEGSDAEGWNKLFVKWLKQNGY